MGKASSSKKVARAAGIGGSRSTQGRPPWSFYGVLAVIVILGLVGIVNSESRRSAQISAQGNSAPAVGTTWYTGLAIDECGKVLPNIKTTKDPFGITTKGDGIIYIDPTTKKAAGANATLGKFASSIGMTLNAAALQVPGGKLYRDGDSCEGSAGHVYVEEWTNPAEPQADGTFPKQAADTVKLLNNGLITIAFLPSSDKSKIPQPSTAVVAELNKLVSAANGTSSSTTVAAATPSTTSASPTTTAGSSPSTTAAGSPTTTAPTTTAPASSTTSK
jgi:hypothetical protein